MADRALPLSLSEGEGWFGTESQIQFGLSLMVTSNQAGRAVAETPRERCRHAVIESCNHADVVVIHFYFQLLKSSSAYTSSPVPEKREVGRLARGLGNRPYS